MQRTLKTTGWFVAVATCAWVASALIADAPAYSAGKGKFIGANKCKNCHSAKAHGDQFGTWKKMKHAKAWELLGTDKAKEVGKKVGVDNPQTNDKCLKCHVTAFGEPAANLGPGFDRKLGVQCESCHGEGEKHFKTRFAAAGDEDDDEGFGDEKKEAAWVSVPADELIAKPPIDTCKKCHNKESPSFKEFNCKDRIDEILHLDPRSKRTKAQVEQTLCK